MISAMILTAVLAGGSPDHIGYEESLYKGKWYVAAHEPIRKCIMWRESRHNYRAANPKSSARGAYQFLDRAWRVSLTHMLRPEHKIWSKELQELRNKPINKWSRYWQDAAFWVAWQKGEGKQHWSLQRKECW